MIAGVDGCKKGWLVAMSEAWPPVEPPRLMVVPNFSALVEATKECKIVVVDMPIGLPSGSEERRCDIEARKLLGKSASSLFRTPPRETLPAGTVQEFQKMHRESTGKGAGLPVWGIVPKLREVDEQMTPKLQERIKEYHPELVWQRLADGPLVSKHRAAGIVQRLRILRRHIKGISNLDEWPEESATRAALLDDVLDALAGLSVAHAIATNSPRATRPPNSEPQKDEHGLQMEIWY